MCLVRGRLQTRNRRGIDGPTASHTAITSPNTYLLAICGLRRARFAVKRTLKNTSLSRAGRVDAYEIHEGVCTESKPSAEPDSQKGGLKRGWPHHHHSRTLATVLARSHRAVDGCFQFS